MSDPAREEADRYFNQKEHFTSHPEDRQQSQSDSEGEHQYVQDEKSAAATRSAAVRARDSEAEDTDDDEYLSNRMATMTATSRSKTTYTVPSHLNYANTGPKGVIADAQSYDQARRKGTFRTTLTAISNNLSSSSEKRAHSKSSSRSRSQSEDETDRKNNKADGRHRRFQSSAAATNNLDDDDEEFMTRWRATRMQEMQAAPAGSAARQSLDDPRRKFSPSRFATGTVHTVSIAAYLDAIESPALRGTKIVVLLYDMSRRNAQSVRAEQALDSLAARHLGVKFLKLAFAQAAAYSEMESLQCPCLIGYLDDRVTGTVNGAADGAVVDETRLERLLAEEGLL